MGQSMPPRRLLIVDDNIDAAQLIAEIFAVHGYTVLVAYSGKEALKKAELFSPEVIFLDIGMPEMDGYEVATNLRHLPWAKTLRIVALTAWDDTASRARAIDSGFDAHLVKPAQLASLLSEAEALGSLRQPPIAPAALS